MTNEKVFSIRCFGVAKEITGGSEIQLKSETSLSVRDLQSLLLSKYPAFESLSSLRIAVNEEYGSDELMVEPGDDIVLIPPVSGG